MNIFTATALLLLLLVVGGSDVPGERKRVGCYYIGEISERYGTLYPEDINAYMCTHLLYLNGAINSETYEIYLKPPAPNMKTGGEGFIPRLKKLKEVNPDLKLILNILVTQTDWLSQGPSSRSSIIQSGVKWLNESGFDGLEFSASVYEPEETEKMADFICEMKNELDKFGYTVMTSLTGGSPSLGQSVSKIARCSDHIGLITHYQEWSTHRIAPMSIITPNVDWFVEKGVPARNILVTVPSFGLIAILEDPKDTKMGAGVSGPGNDDRELMGGFGIRNKEILRKMNDSSLGWTIHRDNETKEPYAFTTTGLWTSYEDINSTEYKARYVLERGLGGINIVAMDFEDDQGIGGEGKFPLMRTVYNTFRRENQPVNTGN